MYVTIYHIGHLWDIYSILIQCWTTVCDIGPTLNQHWDNMVWYSHRWSGKWLRRKTCIRAWSYTDSGALYCFAVGFPLNTQRQPNAVSMLGQRLRRWPNIDPASSRSLVFAGFGRGNDYASGEIKDSCDPPCRTWSVQSPMKSGRSRWLSLEFHLWAKLVCK